MAVKLLGLPRNYKQRIFDECKQLRISASEYFRTYGKEIKSITDLRENSLWFMQPSGNTFIYKALSWFSEAPVFDEDVFAPDAQRCIEVDQVSGRQCLRFAGHPENEDEGHLMMGLVTFRSTN